MDVFPAFARPMISTLNLTSGALCRSLRAAIVPRVVRRKPGEGGDENDQVLDSVTVVSLYVMSSSRANI